MSTLKEDLANRVKEYDYWAKRRLYGPEGHNNRSLWVLACMDERLPVDEALGILTDKPAGGGDAHCFRNAGGIATDDAIRSAMLLFVKRFDPHPHLNLTPPIFLLNKNNFHLLF